MTQHTVKELRQDLVYRRPETFDGSALTIPTSVPRSFRARHMRRAARLVLVALVAIVTAVLLTFSTTMTSAVVALTATYFVKGTNSAFNPIPDNAYPAFVQKYDNAVGAPTTQPIIPVPYPASFWPVTPPGYIFSPTYDQSVAQGVYNLEGLRPLNSNSPDTIWGYSQGATVVTLYKEAYNAQATPPTTAPTFVLVANPNRPNGGILERGAALGTVPILGVTFGNPTPTTTKGQTGITTYDIARQYDGIADAPVNPLNPVADLNAMMGFYYLHGQYPNANPSTAINQGTFGDTQYYLIPTYPLPLLMPLESIPVIGFPLADTLDPPLRVIVESAYDRSSSPGVPTPFNPLYFPNPATFGTNLLVAIPTGLDNGISDFTQTRPFGTTRPGPYGVGGPPNPQLSTPTPGTSPTIPVLFGSPGGGFFALLVPANLLGSLTAGSGFPGIPSMLNPLNGLPNLGSVAGQTPTGAAAVVPAVASTNDTQATTFDATDTSQPLTPGPAGNPSNGPDVTPAASQPSADPQPGNTDNTNPGPRLNVLRTSLGAPDSQPGSSSSNGSQSTNNPIGSAVSGVTNSISSALGGLSKALKGGTK